MNHSMTIRRLPRDLRGMGLAWTVAASLVLLAPAVRAGDGLDFGGLVSAPSRLLSRTLLGLTPGMPAPATPGSPMTFPSDGAAEKKDRKIVPIDRVGHSFRKDYADA